MGYIGGPSGIRPSGTDRYYPASEIQLPPVQLPPQGMPAIAWQSYGELRSYADIAALNASGDPGTVLPKDEVLDLRRAYYAAVTQTDFMVGKVLAALQVRACDALASRDLRYVAEPRFHRALNHAALCAPHSA